MDLNDDKLSYLLSGSCKALPNSYNKLRSYLNTHSANVAEQLNLKLPKCFNNRNITCPFCFLPWSSTTSSLKLLPAKKLTAYQKQKVKNDSTRDEDEIRESSVSKNKLVLKCKMCSNKTSFLLKKKNQKLDNQPEVEKIEVIKKKKGKSCGLKTASINFPNETKSQYTNFFGNQKNKTISHDSHTAEKNSYISLKNSTKSDMPGLNKNVSKIKKPVINPFSIQNQKKIFKKNRKKLQQLSQAVKEDKGSIRNSLKEFLSSVSR